MGFIQELFHSQKKVHAQDDACSNMIAYIDAALRDAKALFSAPQEFIDPSAEITWKNRYSQMLSESAVQNMQHLKKAPLYMLLSAKHQELLFIAHTMPQQISQHNARVIQLRIEAAYALIGAVEGRRLDQQQMTCIVKEAHNHLVIAGAGTGKTTTVVGKIKYLLKTGKYLPQDILVLSFTNASASEMSERIAAETQCKIAASTFHKLGLNIIAQVQGVMPRITQINLRKFIKFHLQSNMQSDWYKNLLGRYLIYNRVPTKSEFDFKCKEDYDEYLMLNPPITLNNEKVKSYGEMDIANFLTQNGIKYIYEPPYEIDTRTTEYEQYHPDFYLPDYHIYIEYFGINRNGEVPAHFQSENGKTATQAYQDSMTWKRNLHRENQTSLIEFYAYERMEGTLQTALKEKLEDASVTLIPQSSEEIWNQVTGKEDSVIDGLVELFETLINLIKSNGYTIETVKRICQNGTHAHNNHMLLSLLEPISRSYDQYLSNREEIDFNDMINLASKYVRQGKYTNPYKYVIVDEYQDISYARFALLKCLRDSRNYDLFCVGDDWQSIYRFAGSDIGFILNFSAYWGATEISRIETTYRFSQRLIDISSGFIMQNPAQIKKYIRGKIAGPDFPLGEISGYNDKYAIEALSDELNDLPQGSSVFLIGRYSFDAKLLHNSKLFSCRYNNTSGYIDVKMESRPDLNMIFLTAHKSKGLQADYVFIINNKKGRMGFPSKIQDAPIFDLLLNHCDPFPYSEERRLFYVALTRAKKKAFLLTVHDQESEFVRELKIKYRADLRKEQLLCPLCGSRLLKRNGPYGEFWGCSNYRKNGCTYKRKIGIKEK